MKAKIYMDKDAQPRFCRARQVPYALKAKVEAEIDRLVKEEVLEPVQFSEWATPVVPVLKKDGSVRLCGDYRITVNRDAKTDTYPLPRIERIFLPHWLVELFSRKSIFLRHTCKSPWMSS